MELLRYKNVKRNIYNVSKSTLCIMLLLLEQIIFTIFMFTRGKSDEYLSIVLLISIMNIAVILLTHIVDGSLKFSFLWQSLVNIGIVTQLLCGVNLKTIVVINGVSLFVGAIIAVLLLTINEEKNTRKIRIIFFILDILILVVLMLFGKMVATTSAWLSIGGNSLQLTEISKFISLMYIAALWEDKRLTDKKKIKFNLIFLMTNTVFYLVIEEMGTLIIIYLMSIIASYIFCRKQKYAITMLSIIVGMTGVGIFLLFIAHLISSKTSVSIFQIANNVFLKQQHRWDMWLNIKKLSSDATYQIVTAQKAITIGGLFGSSHTYYIPAGSTDFIFVSLILKLGYFLGIIVLVFYFAMLMEGLIISYKNKGIKRTMDGIFSIALFTQALLMILGSCRAFILTGIGVPILSRGGSSQVIATVSVFYILLSSGKKDITKKIKKTVNWKRGGKNEN